jgi:predicted ATP-grasp superfamily ATP-dependent carboligase
MGDMDLVRPLGLAGIRCAVVAQPGSPPLYSRFARAAIYWENFSKRGEELIEELIRFGNAQPEPPVLFYEEDSQLLLVSRYRERLAQAFRFVIADPVLVENLVDKARFQILAERLQLPVPAARRIPMIASSAPPDLDLTFPLIIKPLTHDALWDEIGCSRKALRVDTPKALRELWPHLIAAGMDLLAQEMVPGPESCIESYHVYVDGRGNVVGEFTGRKVRTYPICHGHSTALVITDAIDIAQQGRAMVKKMNLQGVAKFDFKRDPVGRLHLLEVNPRFNLWHHLGAIAGVNLPALVYADIVGLTRPATAHAQAGIRWCRISKDLLAARACGMSVSAWLRWMLRCEAKATLAWDDPMPFVRSTLSQCFSRHAVPRAPLRWA